MIANPVFKLTGVFYSYPGSDKPALNGLDLEISAGEWVALVGSNGSGKSTAAKIFNALLLPSQGACTVFGLDTLASDNVDAIRQEVALVFQNPEDQIVTSIVEEDVAFGPENLQLPQEEIRRRVDNALELVGLSKHSRRGTHTLSGGQKQRLALAGALALEPRALVLDESTSMLDPEGRALFLGCLEKLSEEGLTIVQITHRMEEAVRADRIVVLDSGRVSWDGTPAGFFQKGDFGARFDEPSELRLYRKLIEAGIITADTKLDPATIVEAICR